MGKLLPVTKVHRQGRKIEDGTRGKMRDGEERIIVLGFNRLFVSWALYLWNWLLIYGIQYNQGKSVI